MSDFESWFLQAVHDLDAAKAHLDAAFYDWSCFACQQAIEKALKALYIQQRKSLPPKTHLNEVLAMELKLPEDFLRGAARTSGDYLVARYPDSIEGVPFESYSSELTLDRIATAEKILAYVKGKLYG